MEQHIIKSDIMRIMFVTNCLGYGGAEKMLMFVALGLSSRGHDVAIANLNEGNYETGEWFYGNIVVYEGNVKYKNSLQYNYAQLKFVMKSAKEHNSEILIGFSKLSNLCVTLAGHKLKIPSIIAERNDPSVFLKNAGIIDRMKFSIINTARGGVFQTKGAMSYYSKKLQQRSVVISNPIDKAHNIKDIDYERMPKEVIYLGRLKNKQKRFDILLHSFRKFHETHGNYFLRVYGNGPDEAFMDQLIDELGMKNMVKKMGVSRQSMQDLSMGGIFLITSDFEGISNSLLEAMAVGLPVVSTDHTPGGARLLITDHENGLLVPRGDVDAIAKALGEFADNPELACRCGKNATYVLKAFAPDKILSQWEDYINKIRNEE